MATVKGGKLEQAIAEIRDRQKQDDTCWGIIVTDADSRSTNRLKRGGYEVIAKNRKEHWSLAVKIQEKGKNT